MATIALTEVTVGFADGNLIVSTWGDATASFTASGDVGDAADNHSAVDRCVQMAGTFNGGTMVLEGSNDGTNYFTLNNAQGAALTFTAAGLKQVVETPRYIRPRATAGSGMSVTVVLVERRGFR